MSPPGECRLPGDYGRVAVGDWHICVLLAHIMHVTSEENIFWAVTAFNLFKICPMGTFKIYYFVNGLSWYKRFSVVSMLNPCDAWRGWVQGAD
jgi:hypothetical protein